MKKIIMSDAYWSLVKRLKKLQEQQSGGPPPVLYPRRDKIKDIIHLFSSSKMVYREREDNTDIRLRLILHNYDKSVSIWW